MLARTSDSSEFCMWLMCFVRWRNSICYLWLAHFFTFSSHQTYNLNSSFLNFDKRYCRVYAKQFKLILRNANLYFGKFGISPRQKQYLISITTQFLPGDNNNNGWSRKQENFHNSSVPLSIIIRHDYFSSEMVY